jgi:hypothetical protein
MVNVRWLWVLLVLGACARERIECVSGYALEGERCVPLDAAVGDAGQDAGDAGPCGGACSGATPYCDQTSRRCVACLEDAQCPASAPICRSGACGGCQASTECSRFPNSKVCDSESGACVRCSTVDELACDGTSCNPQTHECTATPVHTVLACGRCIADSECADGARCVPMDFQGSRREGGYCLTPSSQTCSRPYATLTSPRSSLSGATPEPYCGINEQLTTCEVVSRFADACSSAGACGDAVEGALCQTIGAVGMACTYPCDSVLECPNSTTCDVYCRTM